MVKIAIQGTEGPMADWFPDGGTVSVRSGWTPPSGKSLQSVVVTVGSGGAGGLCGGGAGPYAGGGGGTNWNPMFKGGAKQPEPMAVEAAADAIIDLINSKPRSPTRDEIIETLRRVK